MNVNDIDLRAASEDELKGLGKTIIEEVERREFIRNFQVVANANHKRLQELSGVVETPGEAWAEPHPLQPATAYTKGAVVTHEGARYVSLIPMNLLPPTSRAWKQQPTQ